MATLTDADRRDCWAEYMRELPAALSKADLRAAVNAADDWANTNAAGYNLALPLAARTSLTSAQKARLLALVILKRWQKGA